MPIARINGRILHFVHIPKTGGSSINAYLRAKGRLGLYSRTPVPWAQTTPQHMDRATQVALIPAQFCDAAFTVLRDPEARLVSEFRYRARRHAEAEGTVLRPGVDGAVTLEIDWGETFHGSFDAWVAEVLRRHAADPFTCDNHIRPQADFWRPGLKTFLLEDGLEPVFDWIDRKTATARTAFRRDDNQSPKLPVAMSTETRAAMRRFYAADFELVRRIAGDRPAAVAS